MKTALVLLNAVLMASTLSAQSVNPLETRMQAKYGQFPQTLKSEPGQAHQGGSCCRRAKLEEPEQARLQKKYGRVSKSEEQAAAHLRHCAELGHCSSVMAGPSASAAVVDAVSPANQETRLETKYGQTRQQQPLLAESSGTDNASTCQHDCCRQTE